MTEAQRNSDADPEVMSKGSNSVSSGMSAGMSAALVMTTGIEVKYLVNVLNVSKLKEEQTARLWHFRLLHRDGEVPVEMTRRERASGIKCSTVLNEDCATCDHSHLKVAPFKRISKDNPVFGIREKFEPWERVHCDGYGGQDSMGCKSYDGAVGGFVFVCVATRARRRYLYSTKAQYPVILNRFFIWLDFQKRKCRIIVVDTDAILVSQETEAVADDWHCTIQPISAGTPQENAIAEKAVGDMRRDSRAVMLGAPHLPKWCWGLADGWVCYVHYLLPNRSNSNVSPYQLCEGRIPDLVQLFVHVFGCPVSFKPMKKTKGWSKDKNAAIAIAGWFVGVAWPRVLVLRKCDMKVVAVSRKKVICYEHIYCLPPHQNPIMNRLVSIDDWKEEYDEEYVPKSVQSVKVIEDAVKHFDSEKEKVDRGGHSNALEEDSTVVDNQGEPFRESELFSEDNKAIDHSDGPGIVDRISKRLQKSRFPSDLRSELVRTVKQYMHSRQGQAIARNELRRKKRKREVVDVGQQSAKPVESISLSSDPVTADEDAGMGMGDGSDDDNDDDDGDGEATTPVTRSSNSTSVGCGSRKRKHSVSSHSTSGSDSYVKGKKARSNSNAPVVQRKLYQMPRGTRVAINTARFGVEYAKGKPKLEYGTLVRKGKRGVLYVRWDNDDSITRSHWTHLSPVGVGEKLTVHTLIATIVRGVELQFAHSDSKQPFPRSFFECLVRHDWRKWVEAVRKEMQGWEENEAYKEVSIREVPPDAALIPLGELYSIKRDGRHKYRQIAYGNLLRKGIDFKFTFSTTIGADALRWFLSVACACGKKIRGLDVSTAYLTADQRIPLFCYKPSHADFSGLSIEELAVLRAKLLEIVKKDGVGALKRLQRKLNKTEEERKVWQLVRAVYGVPDAGNAFAMRLQGVLRKDCGLVQCDVEPCIWFKVEYYDQSELLDRDKGKEIVKDWVLLCSWTDDLRYFGTDKMLSELEEAIVDPERGNLKVTLQGEIEDFVALDIVHDIEAGTLEVKQPQYWVSAVDRFAEYFPRGPRKREIPWGENVKIEAATAAEVEEAQHLPLRELLGVMGFPILHTKLEARVYLQLLQQQTKGWSKQHFQLALQLLEYCYTTREIGIMFSNCLDSHGVNLLYAYADSSFEVPRSRGCSLTMMNGGPIAYRTGRHTTSDDSTMKAEITECYHASCDVVALRNLMAEVGLFQDDPTLIYQDNQPAIQVAENRGVMSKASKALQIRVYGLRNRIEDQEVMVKYISTLEMVADLGTKLFGVRRFKYLRDLVNGYALVRASGRKMDLPVMVVTMRELTHRSD